MCCELEGGTAFVCASAGKSLLTFESGFSSNRVRQENIFANCGFNVLKAFHRLMFL